MVSPQPLIFDFYKKVANGTAVGGIVQYYDNQCQSIYVTSDGISTVTGKVNKGHWSDVTFSGEVDIAEDVEKTAIEYADNSILHFATVVDGELYYYRYLNSLDISDIYTNGTYSQTADNVISQLSLSLINIDNSLFNNSGTLFQPGAMIDLRMGLGKKKPIPICICYLDEVDFNPYSDSVAISGRNTAGFILAESKLGNYNPTYFIRKDAKGSTTVEQGEVKVSTPLFKSAVNNVNGEYMFTYYDGYWHLVGTPVSLGDYGIVLTAPSGLSTGNRITVTLSDDYSVISVRDTKTNILTQLLTSVGITYYAIQSQSTEYTFHFGGTASVLDCIKTVLSSGRWKLVEMPDGKIVIGSPGYIYANYLYRNSAFVFNAERELFSRNAVKSCDGSYSKVCIYKNGLTPVYVDVPNFTGWRLPGNKIYYEEYSGDEQNEMQSYASEVAEELQYIGLTEDFSGIFRPDMVPGDFACIYYGNDSSNYTKLGNITSIKHHFGVKGYYTDFSIDSGGMSTENNSVVKAVNGFNRRQNLSDLIKFLTKRRQ